MKGKVEVRGTLKQRLYTLQLAPEGAASLATASGPTAKT